MGGDRLAGRPLAALRQIGDRACRAAGSVRRHRARPGRRAPSAGSICRSVAADQAGALAAAERQRGLFDQRASSEVSRAPVSATFADISASGNIWTISASIKARETVTMATAIAKLSSTPSWSRNFFPSIYPRLEQSFGKMVRSEGRSLWPFSAPHSVASDRMRRTAQDRARVGL